ncbi:MAG TPA: GAF domain-containing protein [Candidatus Micrarchaeia archaeon]|nr:GAF domain-containing protein [Candidatus Micrarchaeia archaeon]
MPPRRPDADTDDAKLRELLFLQRLSTAAATTVEPDALLDLVIRETTGAMRTDVCSLYLHDPERSELVLTATNGLNVSQVGQVRLRLGEGVTGWVAEHRRPLVVPRVAAEPRFRWIPGVDDPRFTSMLSVPILAGPRMIGVLNVQTVPTRAFVAPDIDFLAAIAGGVAGIIERSELQRRLETQLDEIRSSQEIHERFTQLALAGAGLEAILEAIGSLARAHVDLYDPQGFRLHRQGPPGLPLGRLALPSGLARGDRAGPVSAQAGRPRRRLWLTPIRTEGELVAVLAAEPSSASAVPAAGRVGGEAEVLAPILRRALEHGATVLALELAKERAAAEVERRLRGDLVEALLSHGLAAAEASRLAAQAGRLGSRVAEHSFVLVVEPDDEEAARRLGSRPFQDRIHEAVDDLCQRRVAGALVVTRPTSLVVLAPSGRTEETEEADAEAGTVDRVPDQQRIVDLARGIQDLVRRLAPDTAFSVGIGNLAQGLEALPLAHDQARQALRLVRRGGGRGQVVSYRSLGALRLLLEVRDPQAITRFVDETLGPVLRPGGRRTAPLLATLEALVRHRWNRRATARGLALHVNSLAYRIRTIESETGLRIDDPEARVLLTVALQARTLLSPEGE